MGMHRSQKKRIMEITSIVDSHYEKGRHDRCIAWIYRSYIEPRYGITLRTLYRYLKLRDSMPLEEEVKADNRQKSLFDGY
jgi:hypothetical protein